MASNREFQNNGIPGAFGSQYGGRSLYSENNPAYTRPEEAFQQGGYHTGEGYGGMRQEAPRRILGERSGNFLAPPPVPKQRNNTSHIPEERPDGVTAAFEQFQQREQAQFRGPRDHYAGSNVAASASGYEQPRYEQPRYEQPRYANQPSSTAYENYASNQYRPSGRSGRTSNLRNEVLNDEEDYSSYPAFRNQGSSTAFAPGGAAGYQNFDPSQQSRQHSAWSQNREYGGAYGARNIGQANSATAYPQSPYLLPGQGPHDLNQPPPAFQTRSPAFPGSHGTHSARQGYPTMEHTRPQSTSTRTGGVDDPINLSDDAEEPKQELGKTDKKKKGPPIHKCATLKKTMLKQGETKLVSGQLMWSDPNEPEDQKWKPAVSMDDIRKYILRQQDRVAQALGCSYLYPDESGGEPYSDTAFYFPHRHIGEARDARPDILFAIDETETNNPQPSYDPGWMMWDPVKREVGDSGTLLVLDPADNPIVNWKEIPLCLSPQISGAMMENIRRVNKAVRQRDLWARMPRWYLQKPGDPQSRREISTVNTMVNMPSKRFRQKAGCLTWTDRGGSDELEVGLKELLNRTETGRQCIAANSMRGFGRDLNGVERLQVKRGNAHGKFLNKAGSRAIDEQTRNERRDKEDERIAKAQRLGDLPMPVPSTPSLPAILSGTGAGSQPAESRKRNRSNDEADSDVSENDAAIQQRPQKRLRPARKEHSRRTEDDDLGMFDQPQAVVEDADAAQRHQLGVPAREEVVYGEGGDVSSEDSLFGEGGEDVDEDVDEGGEESPEDSLFEEGEENIDEETPEAGVESEDDNDPYTPDEIPVSSTGNPIVHIDDEEEDGEYDEDEGDDEGEVENTDDEPKTGTPYPIPPDPYRQPTSADNARAGLSDLEGYRRWVREMLDVR